MLKQSITSESWGERSGAPVAELREVGLVDIDGMKVRKCCVIEVANAGDPRGFMGSKNDSGMLPISVQSSSAPEDLV